MNLASLIDGLEVGAVRGALPAGDVGGLAYDSRRVRPGWLFAALKGVQADGHDYIAKAVRSGAIAALVEDPSQEDICQVQVSDARLALALAAAQFHGHPSSGLTLVGITGTNGKTTISYLVESILSQMGPAGVIGTVEARFAGERRPAETTTPESVDLQALLAEMVRAGVKGAAMEVSSHGLEQHRASGCLFDLALFTNLSRDHLDYHGDMDAYFEAKSRLFTELLPQAAQAGKNPAAVIFNDDPRGRELARRILKLGIRTITYGLETQAEVRGLDASSSLDGSRIRMVWAGGELELTTSLVGEYNLQNCLAAGAAGLALGLDPSVIASGIESLPGVPGRLERVWGPEGSPAVFVDYCHTPDALAGALEVLRPLTKGRLWCVFGAGGDRDQGKRPLMGLAAGRGADLTILTSDNPRSEDPGSIMGMIEPGLLEAGVKRTQDLEALQTGGFLAQPDRALAIAQALASADSKDVVLIAGKGHEDYQIIGGQKRHFDDREEAAQALAARGGGVHAQA